MAGKDLVERFQKAFREPEKVEAAEYQKIIEANAAKTAEYAERLTFILLGLVMFFIFVIQGDIKKVDLGFVQIEDPSIILVAMPILIAYIHFDLVATLSKFDLLSVIHKTIIKQRHQPIHEQRLAKYFLFLPTIYEQKYFSSGGVIQRIQSYLWIIQFFSITIVIPLGFQVILYWKLFTPRDPASPNPPSPALIAASLVITLLFSLQSVLTTIALFREAQDR